MAEDGKLDKLKEQYVDEVMAIIPLAQAVFIILMSISSDRIMAGKSLSVLDALGSFGLKSALGPDDGYFWEVSLLSICLSFALALLNTFFIRYTLENSVRKANLEVALLDWQREASLRTISLTDSQKMAIQTSFKGEIEIRVRKYKAKRISCELIVAVGCLMIYSTALLVFQAWKNGGALQWSWRDALFLIGAFWIGFLLHRAAIRYAISKILPLKIYVGVITGEMVFFEQISS